VRCAVTRRRDARSPRMRLLVLLLLGCSSAAGDPHADEGPLVIELFTSQGCSSCPAAERLLDKLSRAGQLGGRTLAPLAFHVDYWDDLGWADPYAKPAWTERQHQYATALGDHRVYTPELVVAGGAGLVGSQSISAAKAIASAPRQQKLAAKAAWTKTTITVETTPPAGTEVWVAIWEDGTETKVPRGENAGETLRGDRVVRALERMPRTGKLTLAIDPAWHAAGAVAFAQRADKKIIGATLLPRS